MWTKGQYPDAAQEFAAEIANDPKHVQAKLYLADTQIKMNQMDEARMLLEQIGKTDSSIAMQHLDLGIVYAEQDRKPEAQAEFETAVKLDPKNVNGHYRLARLYKSMGITARAKAEFDKTNGLNKAEDDRLLKIMSTVPVGKDAKEATKPSIEK